MKKFITLILVCMTLIPAFAQTKKVSGTVRDENSEVLTGAIVVVKSGGANGCIIGDYLYYGQGDAIKRIVAHYSDDYVRAVDILGNFGYKANGSSGIPKYDYAHPTAAGMDKIASFVYQKVGEWID